MASNELGYVASDFGYPDKQCDVVMKGGVASGLVYPFAILELAKVYRFRSIGGTSAGGIAAALTAAAEYARTKRNDPEGFVRLATYSRQLPELLGTFFQPARQFAPTMAFLVAWKASSGKGEVLWAAFKALWAPFAAGAGLVAGVMALFGAGVAGIILGAIVGGIAGLIFHAIWIARALKANDYGMCSGMPDGGMKQPALTTWLHEAIQNVAFGPEGRDKPLTFGDLEGDDPDTAINLRMITTNLSMRRPHTLPALGVPASYRLEEWGPLFPEPVLRHLGATSEEDKRYEGLRKVPAPADFPVLVATRMSLSFPLLFRAIPLYARDFENWRLKAQTGVVEGRPEMKRLWFIDGGLSSNFPIHLFDALLPSRPTFALSLDELPEGGDEKGPRVMLPKSALDGVGLPIHDVDGLLGYGLGLLDAAKDWQDNLLSSMPGQRERVARVLLSKTEGGLNLTMPPDVSRAVMGYGREVGQLFANGALDFDEHRWRRALVAYEQLELAVDSADRAWTARGYGAWYNGYAPKTYGKVTAQDRTDIGTRLAAFAGLAGTFLPGIKSRDRKLPRPIGRMRIGPDA